MHIDYTLVVYLLLTYNFVFSKFPPAITEDEPEDAPLSHDETQETTLDETPIVDDEPPVITPEEVTEEPIAKSVKKPVKKVKEVPVVEAVVKAEVPVVVETAVKLPKSPTKEETDAEVISRSGRKIKPKR